jgi:hypothetical protein
MILPAFSPPGDALGDLGNGKAEDRGIGSSGCALGFRRRWRAEDARVWGKEPARGAGREGHCHCWEGRWAPAGLAGPERIGSGRAYRLGPERIGGVSFFLIFRIHFLVQRKIQKNLDKSFKAQKIL